MDTPFEYEMYCVQMVRRNVPGVGEPDHGPPLPRAQTGGGARWPARHRLVIRLNGQVCTAPGKSSAWLADTKPCLDVCDKSEYVNQKPEHFGLSLLKMNNQFLYNSSEGTDIFLGSQ